MRDKENFYVNDCALFRSDGAHPYVGRIVDLWEDKTGEKMLNVKWFFRGRETALDPAIFQPQEIFLSSIVDPNPLGTLFRKCYVFSNPVLVSKEDPLHFLCTRYYDPNTVTCRVMNRNRVPKALRRRDLPQYQDQVIVWRRHERALPKQTKFNIQKIRSAGKTLGRSYPFLQKNTTVPIKSKPYLSRNIRTSPQYKKWRSSSLSNQLFDLNATPKKHTKAPKPHVFTTSSSSYPQR
jgi:hypothetical protein